METTIFEYGQLPEFIDFTPERIDEEFPYIISKIKKDFKYVDNM